MEYSSLKRLAQKRKIVLGSGSPRRKKLLGEIGIEFEQIIPQVLEKMNGQEKPYDFALRMAESKADWVAAKTDPGRIVIGCDTIVVHNEEVLGKPRDAVEAGEILGRLAGCEHVVCTALALVTNRKTAAIDYELTVVTFNNVSDTQINEYIRSGEPLDKAGAYGIQGMGAFLVDSIEGSLDNVIGLPRNLLERLASVLLEQEKG